MRSIRLSLIVYFLLLLAVGLAAVSGLAYWTTAKVVAARQESMRKLYCSQYGRRIDREKSKLDNALLFQARTLASLTQFQFQGSRLRYQPLTVLGVLGSGFGPGGIAQAPVWAAEGVKGPLFFRLHRLSATEIQFNEDDLPSFPDGPVTEYFQVTSEWGNTWRSRSLDDDSLPFNSDAFEALKLFDWQFKDVELKPNDSLRQVTLKAPASRFRYVLSSRFPGPDMRPEVFSRTPPNPNTAESATPALLVQVACDTTRRDAALDLMKHEHDEDLAEVAEEGRTTLANLRNQLLAISLATFAGTFLGGFALIRAGLAPLRRLSEAVSQVSLRDCRLQFDDRKLPGELRPIVERLSETLEQLSRAFAREKQAAADISHELRTPLAALLTTTELALRKPRSSEEYRELLSDCHQVGQQMSQLVERLLSLARLDAGVDTLRPREVDANALAEQCAALVRPLAQARELTLRVHRNGPASLTTDPDKLREVLTNLLHNAIEYNRPQGTVDLRVERQNGQLSLEVRDTGIGIAPEAREHIFERFYRVDPARCEAGLHAGLGLAIVKGYIDLMGGSITVESNGDAGTVFRVLIRDTAGPGSHHDLRIRDLRSHEFRN